MPEINARTLMFNLGPEDAIDSTTLAKIARYADRKQLTYKVTKKGTLLLDGRGKKIHLRKGVVTLRNVLDLHDLPERVVSRYRLDDFRQSHDEKYRIKHRDERADTDEHVACAQDGVGRAATAEIVARKHDATATSR